MPDLGGPLNRFNGLIEVSFTLTPLANVRDAIVTKLFGLKQK